MARAKVGTCTIRIDRRLHAEFKAAVAAMQARDLKGSLLRKGPLLEMFAALFMASSPRDRARLVDRCKDGLGQWIEIHPQADTGAHGNTDTAPVQGRRPKVLRRKRGAG